MGLTTNTALAPGAPATRARSLAEACPTRRQARGAVIGLWPEVCAGSGLDMLAESPPSGPSPMQLWEGLDANLFQAQPGALLALQPHSDDKFQQTRCDANKQLQTTIRSWQELYYRVWLTGVCGAAAKRHASQLRPGPAAVAPGAGRGRRIRPATRQYPVADSAGPAGHAQPGDIADRGARRCRRSRAGHP